MARVRAGQLNRRITLERSSTVRDESGGFTTHWECYMRCMARIQPVRGAERFEAQQVHPEVTHTIRIRWTRTRPSPQDRVLFEDRVFNVESVIDVDEARVVYELACKELVGVESN